MTLFSLYDEICREDAVSMMRNDTQMALKAFRERWSHRQGAELLWVPHSYLQRRLLCDFDRSI